MRSVIKMNDDKTKHVLVVGGGTSGWITACYLAKKLGTKHPGSVKVTLIESADIPTIGVGEGTFPTIKTTLQFLGISENDFLKCTDASFKQAIKFDNWLHNPEQTHLRNSYYHLFDVPKGAPTFDISPYWLTQTNRKDFDFTVSTQATLCEENIAPKKITTKQFDGLNYAYHLDAVKFAAFLKEFAISTLGVTHLTGTVNKVHLDQDEFISSVESIEHGAIEADLFVDCTGFNSLIMGKTYQVDLVDIKQHLFVDSAVTLQIPYEHDNSLIKTHTISTAQEAGWTWDIGLTTRRGIGYVYASDYSSPEQAEYVLKQYIGPAAEQLTPRHIAMPVGYRKKQWHKNCVAIGLSAGFIEPLESTAIAMIELAAKYLCEEFPHTKSAMPLIEKRFNNVFIHRWQAIVDFVKLHYALSKRTDSSFWLDNVNSTSWPESLVEKLTKWSHSPPTVNDFPSRYDIFGLESHQYVLYGMGFEPNTAHMAASMIDQQKLASQLLNQVTSQTAQLKKQLPLQRELLNKVQQFGFPSI